MPNSKLSITMRDYFAARIVVGLLSQRIDNNESDPTDRGYIQAYPGRYIDCTLAESEVAENLAMDAYAMADAMIAVRRKS